MSFFFVSRRELLALAAEHRTPFYIYDEDLLEERVSTILSMPGAFGLTVRYAMKANSSTALLLYFRNRGLYFDASSAFEAMRAVQIGIKPEHVLLTAQEMGPEVPDLIRSGVQFNATSLHQLSEYARHFPGSRVGVRLNPGMGSGHNNRTNVGGPNSSFGIWHEYIPEILSIAERADLTVCRLHMHVGSGSDPSVWRSVNETAVRFLNLFPDVTTLNLGGGFKVARMPHEKNTDVRALLADTEKILAAYHAKTGRKIHLEIEPGTWLAAVPGLLVTRIADIVDTGANGHRFLRLDSGMTELTRPTLYGVQHPVLHLPGERPEPLPSDSISNAVVVGHCCESGDILTPEPGNPENFVSLPFQDPRIGDFLLFGASGAYSSSMSLVNYNSFPRAAEFLKRKDGTFALIRRRQRPEQMIENDLIPDNI